MDDLERIVTNPNVLVGKPIIRGTRLSVEFIVGLLAGGWTTEQIVDEYGITAQDVLACLAYAHQILSEEKIFPVTA